jgi:hypothetical protein
MEKKCNHGKGVCFIKKENWKGKNELKKIREMMYETQKNRCAKSSKLRQWKMAST